jgi:ArsR family transcriptional regulator
MKILCDSGLVASRQEGKWTHYRLSDTGRDKAVKALLAITTPDAD